VFFKKQTPRQYAEFSIEGREYSHSIKYISYCIWKLLKDHEEQFRNLNCALKMLEDRGGVPKKGEITKSDIEALRKDFLSKHSVIEQICDMMEVLAVSMNIPSFRISDFLFQFSPDIYNLEMRLCLKRIDEILAYEEATSSPEGLIERAIKIRKSFSTFYERIQYQENLFMNEDLHSSIVDISMGMGLTSSLRAYALGLKKIGSGNNDDDKYVLDRLKFFYHKRRMFPGFDIHCLLINLIEKSNRDESIKNGIKEALKMLALDSFDFIADKTASLKTQNEEKALHYTKLFAKIVPMINMLVDEINRYIYDHREVIVQKFQEYIIDELKQCEIARKKGEVKKMVFITRGYSSVVNDVLYNTFVEKGVSNKEHDNRVKDIRKLLFYNYEGDPKQERDLEIYIYVLKSNHEYEDDSLTSTRYVRYQFKENPDMRKDVGKSLKVFIKVGDEDWLKNRFYKKDECNCYLLSGAEFFQVDDKKTADDKAYSLFRMINTEGVSRLAELGFDQTNLKHIILAENFKHFSRPIKEPLAKNALSRENLEYLHIYKWSPFRVIISDAIYRNSEEMIKHEDILKRYYSEKI
jgi:hypothetical protein